VETYRSADLVAELIADPSRAALVPRADALALAVELARVVKALELLSGASPEVESVSPDAWVTVEEVIAVTGFSRRTVYERAKRGEWKQFAERASRKVLRFRPGLRRLLHGSKRA
jgi:hypothetical protein